MNLILWIESLILHIYSFSNDFLSHTNLLVVSTLFLGVKVLNFTIWFSDFWFSDISQNVADISANYVQKTGDTMTGKLTKTTSGALEPGIEIYSTDHDTSLLLRSDWDDGSSHGEAYIEYRNTHIDLSNNKNVYFGDTGEKIYGDGSHLYVVSSVIIY